MLKYKEKITQRKLLRKLIKSAIRTCVAVQKKKGLLEIQTFKPSPSCKEQDKIESEIISTTYIETEGMLPQKNTAQESTVANDCATGLNSTESPTFANLGSNNIGDIRSKAQFDSPVRAVPGHTVSSFPASTPRSGKIKLKIKVDPSKYKGSKHLSPYSA